MTVWGSAVCRQPQVRRTSRGFPGRHVGLEYQAAVSVAVSGFNCWLQVPSAFANRTR